MIINPQAVISNHLHPEGMDSIKIHSTNSMIIFLKIKHEHIIKHIPKDLRRKGKVKIYSKIFN